MSFDTYYGNHPWAGLTTNQRDWYVPTLRELYFRERQFSAFVTHQFNLAGPGTPVTTNMKLTSIIPPHANFNPLSARQMWMASSYVDSFEREITFERHGGKLSLHKYDQLITYWQQNGKTGLKPIVDKYIGQDMMEQIEMVSRNALLENTYALYGDGGVDFGDVVNYADHKMSTALVEDIKLGMEERGVPFTTNPAGGSVADLGKIVCLTTPGVVRDLRNEASADGNENAFIDVVKYADGMRIIKGELGIYKGIRFVATPRAILYNSGPITIQATIEAPVQQGDGAWASKVEGVRQVGQSGATHYITVNDVDLGSGNKFNLNDIVAIHTSRTADFGVTDGVDHRDGTLQYRRIVNIDAVNNRLSFDLPIMTPMTTDLGSTTYGYVTKGRHIHSSTFMGGLDGVVMGIGQTPTIHTPPPVDDFNSMYRVSWDGHFAAQLFEPEVFEVAFTSGTNRVKGARVQ